MIARMAAHGIEAREAVSRAQQAGGREAERDAEPTVESTHCLQSHERCPSVAQPDGSCRFQLIMTQRSREELPRDSIDHAVDSAARVRGRY